VVYINISLLLEKYKILKDYFSLFIEGFAIRELLIEVIKDLFNRHNEEITGFSPITCRLTICRHLLQQFL
jgi:hypothetical protein